MWDEPVEQQLAHHFRYWQLASECLCLRINSNSSFSLMSTLADNRLKYTGCCQLQGRPRLNSQSRLMASDWPSPGCSWHLENKSGWNFCWSDFQIHIHIKLLKSSELQEVNIHFKRLQMYRASIVTQRVKPPLTRKASCMGTSFLYLESTSLPIVWVKTA